MSSEAIKQKLMPKYLANGEARFYRFLLFYAVNKLLLINNGHKSQSPCLDLLDYYQQFLILYRREGDDIYLDLARLCRKAAHKIYRTLLKNKMMEKNVRFLTLV